MNRITGLYNKSKGDSGYSDLAIELDFSFDREGNLIIKKESIAKISKGSSLTDFYISLEEFQHSISNFINFNPSLIEEEDLLFFKFLVQNSFAINSFIFGAGDQDWCDRYMFDPEAFDWVEKRIIYFQNRECEILGIKKISSEFIVPQGYLNKLRLKCRHLEKSLWAFRDQVKQLFTKEYGVLLDRLDKEGLSENALESFNKKYLKIRERLNYQGGFLNRLSTYFYFCQRYQHVKNHGSFEQWISEAPKLKNWIYE